MAHAKAQAIKLTMIKIIKEGKHYTEEVFDFDQDQLTHLVKQTYFDYAVEKDLMDYHNSQFPLNRLFVVYQFWEDKFGLDFVNEDWGSIGSYGLV